MTKDEISNDEIDAVLAERAAKYDRFCAAANAEVAAYVKATPAEQACRTATPAWQEVERLRAGVSHLQHAAFLARETRLAISPVRTGLKDLVTGETRGAQLESRGLWELYVHHVRMAATASVSAGERGLAYRAALVLRGDPVMP